MSLNQLYASIDNNIFSPHPFRAGKAGMQEIQTQVTEVCRGMDDFQSK